ncbi:MAG: poly-beta-1,6-N-acetyl-D-glucosamine biosynthesis protein PgaD [Gemmatimonadales bacterium]|nr:MAG: poly-beta-1,6-N-acetyl-D-glucosamine biosynthesis protein PgaD [Gemmatimonadales bacterium]
MGQSGSRPPGGIMNPPEILSPEAEVETPKAEIEEPGIEGENVAAPDPPPGTPPSREGLIIERPDLQPPGQRVAYRVVTAIAWVVWGYLWLPLITLLAWFLGVRRFIREVVVPEQSFLLATGFVYIVVILTLAATLVVWSRYNLARFGGRERRQHPPPLPREEMESYFELSEGVLDTLRSGRRTVVDYDAEGRMEDARPLP